jgi:hypothetical protein
MGTKEYSEILVFKKRHYLRSTGMCNYYLAKMYRVFGLEVYKNICLCFSTQKIYEIYVFNSVQSNSKRFLCTSAHFNVGTCCSSTDILPHADKHVASTLHFVLLRMGVNSTRNM